MSIPSVAALKENISYFVNCVKPKLLFRFANYLENKYMYGIYLNFPSISMAGLGKRSTWHQGIDLERGEARQRARERGSFNEFRVLRGSLENAEREGEGSK